MIEMLVLEEVVAGYGKTPILKPINFKVEEGEALLLWGPNGVGKTTLLKTIAGFIKPLSGKILLNGTDIGKVTGQIFYVDERIELPLEVKALDYLKIVGSLYDYMNVKTFSDLLLNFGIRPETKIRELSQGQKRKLQLASIVAASPAKLFLIDDPGVGLDDFSTETLIPGIIERLVQDEKIVLISTRTAKVREILMSSNILDVAKYSMLYSPDEFDRYRSKKVCHFTRGGI